MLKRLPGSETSSLRAKKAKAADVDEVQPVVVSAPGQEATRNKEKVQTVS